MEKILVVDDDVDLLIILEEVLTKAGYLIRTLTGGKDVLVVVHSFHPDLLILDINLGDADGRELCHEIKCHEDFKHLPIILCSAEDFPDINIADCKADTFIFKPFSKSYILEVVKKLLAADITDCTGEIKPVSDLTI
jgi:DNA-binding response OmpR family regulator